MMSKMKKLAAGLLSCVMVLTGLTLQPATAYAATTDLQEGEMELIKTAEPVEGKANTWRVTVTAHSKDRTKPIDYILVVDRSKSMLYDADNTKNSTEQPDSRIVLARDAAKDLVKSIYEKDERNRVAVLSYASAPTSDIDVENKCYVDGASHSTLDIGLSGVDDKAAVDAAIDGLTASGGTYTQLALHQAQELMAEAHDQDPFEDRERVIILLTDGAPTLATEVDWTKVPEDSGYTRTDIDDHQTIAQLKFTSGSNIGKPIYIDNVTGKNTANPTTGGKPNAPKIGLTAGGAVPGALTNTTNIPEEAFNYANADIYTLGYGAALNYASTYCELNDEPIYADIMNLTIAESNFIREKGDVKDFFVIGYDVSREDAQAIGQLAGDSEHYVDAKGEDGINAAMRYILEKSCVPIFYAKVSDQIPVGYTTPQDVEISCGTYSVENGVLNWNIGTPSIPIEGTNPVERYATLSYTLSVDDNVSFVNDVMYNTNGETKVEYDNPLWPRDPAKRVTADVESPQAKVSRIKIAKTVTNDPDDTNTFTINLVFPSGHTETFTLANNTETLITKFTETGVYKVSEVVNENAYAVKYLIDGTETDQFTISTQATDASQNINIQIQNTKKDYNVTYSYVSGTPGKDLPANIIAMTPAGETGIETGTTVDAENPAQTEVRVDGGKWVFKNYDKNSVTIEGQDEEFVGTWEFVEDKFNVSYEFVSGTPDKELPEEVLALLPASGSDLSDGTVVDAVIPAETTVTIGADTWVFKGYDADSKTIDGADIKFIGAWTVTHTPPYKVTYLYESSTPGKDLPADIIAMTPAAIPELDTGDTVTPTDPPVTEYPVEGGKWVFEQYNKDSITIEDSDDIFIGTWKFVETPKYDVTYQYVSGTPGKDLPADIIAMTPANMTDVADGTVVDAAAPPVTELAVDGGKWVFKNYDKNSVTIAGQDEEFIGTWEFVEDPTYNVTYQYVSGTPGKDLPADIIAMTPANMTDVADGTVVDAAAPPVTELAVDGGKWVFKNYDKDSVTIAGQDEEFIGTWEFIADETPTPTPTPDPDDGNSTPTPTPTPTPASGNNAPTPTPAPGNNGGGNSTSGNTGNTQNTPVKGAATSDNSNMILWMAVIIASLSASAVLVYKRRKTDR